MAEHPLERTSARGLLERADGERFPGESVIAADGLRWRNRWIGELPIALEATRSIRFAEGAVVPTAITSDALLLANGDRVEGVIVELGASVHIEADGGNAIEIPLDRIAAVGLITPPETATAPRVWLRDGTVMDAVPTWSERRREVTLRASRVAHNQAATADQPVEESGRAPAPISASGLEEEDGVAITPETIRGFVVTPERILPLGSIRPTELAMSGDLPRFALPEPEVATGAWTIDAPPVVLRGPVRVRYTLPVEGCTVLTELGAAEPDPRWTDCEVIFRDGDRELFRERMTAATKPRWVHAQLRGRDLWIEVTEGERGPVRDAVRLKHALIVRPATDQP